jgi:hypothetical protein
VLGFKWVPGTAGRILPQFNMNQLAEIHAMVLRGAMETGELVEERTKMRHEDLLTHAPSSMQLLGMHPWGEHIGDGRSGYAFPSVAIFLGAMAQPPAEAPETTGGPADGLRDNGRDQALVLGDDGIREIHAISSIIV